MLPMITDTIGSLLICTFAVHQLQKSNLLSLCIKLWRFLPRVSCKTAHISDFYIPCVAPYAVSRPLVSRAISINFRVTRATDLSNNWLIIHFRTPRHDPHLDKWFPPFPGLWSSSFRTLKDKPLVVWLKSLTGALLVGLPRNFEL